MAWIMVSFFANAFENSSVNSETLSRKQLLFQTHHEGDLDRN